MNKIGLIISALAIGILVVLAPQAPDPTPEPTPTLPPPDSWTLVVDPPD